MKIRWPWTRRAAETRASGSGYTAMITAARADYIAGTAGAAELTATAQACVALWEGALAVADVAGTDMLRPAALALIARTLALRGEFVGLLDGAGIVPASEWDVSTVDGRPRAYRLSLPDVGGGRTVTALAPEVVHVALAADVRQPWAGVPPLRRASLSADLLAALEAALVDVYRDSPLGSSIVPMPEMAEDDRTRLAGSFRGQRGRVLIRESVTTTAAGGPAPATDWRPQHVTPNMRDSMAAETVEGARRAVCAAFGVLPAMLEPSAGGPLVREGQRHLAQWTLAPLCALIGAELSEKLGAAVSLDVLRPLQAFDAGGRARAAAGIVQALAQAKEAGLDPATVSRAFAMVDWRMGE